MSIIALLGLVLVSLFAYVYLGRRKEAAERAQLEMNQERERQRLIEVAHDREIRMQAEAEEKARNERRKAAEEAASAEEERKKLQAEKDLREKREMYRVALSIYEDGRLDFIDNMASDEAPGRADGTYYYLPPFSDANPVDIIVVSSSNGVLSACRLSEDGRQVPEDAETFLKTIETRDYLVAYGEHVYFHSKRSNPQNSEIAKNKVIDLTDDFFGTLAPEIKRLQLDFEDLAFEIVFLPANSKKPIFSEMVDAGVRYSLEKVMDAIRDRYPPSNKSHSFTIPKRKKFKRKVVIWDGAHIKRGIDGVTYVPRVAPAATHYGDCHSRVNVWGDGWNAYQIERNRNKSYARAEEARERWEALYDAALKEEEAEKVFYATQESDFRKKNAAEDEIARSCYEQRIQTIFDNGRLFWRARLKWKQNAPK